MNWKKFLVYLTLIVGFSTLFANLRSGVFEPVIPAFFVAGQASDEVLFRAGFVDSTTFVNQYPLGSLLLRSSDLSFFCGNNVDEFVAPQPQKNCWSASLNEKNAVYGQTIDFGFFSARFVPQGRYVKNLGFLSVTDKKINWFLKLNPNIISLEKRESPSVIKQGIPAKYSFVVNNQIDGLMGGFVIKTTRGLFRQESVEVKNVVFGKGENVFVNSFLSDVFGNVKITVTPFVTVYDFGLGFTGEDTGYCFVNKKSERLCVQKRDLSINAEPLIFVFNVVSRDVDLSQDVSTRCFVQTDCPQNFGCVNNICEYKYGGVGGRINIFQSFFEWLNNLLLKVRFG